MPALHRADGVTRALPYWMSLGLVPVVVWSGQTGGWALVAPPLASWGLFSILDRLIGEDGSNPDPQAAGIPWHMALIRLWVPVQIVALFGVLEIWDSWGLSGWEAVALFFGVGILTGTIGITYAHELIHKTNRLDRWLGDVLLSSVLYGHFRTEHLLVHHVNVATPSDPATARYGENFWRYFIRVLPQSFFSAWTTETARQTRRGKSPFDLSNPFWTYAGLQISWLAFAYSIAGPVGLLLFIWQALVAVWQLELVNYVEHYGLIRQKLPNGRYEPVGPQHSWNAAHAASNWLLINLQRHSDHHANPMRPYPLLQTYDREEVPTLPAGYPLITMMALVPRLWMSRMNPRVRAWQRKGHDAEAT
ncbi:MAG: alkane 1-monooxygenase [Pseudomonadota bacterium]